MRSASLIGSDGQRVELGSSTIIGRRDDCDIVLDGPKVSRRHAQISIDSNGALLVDLASVNGTRVNGVEVTSQRLGQGDVVTIGNHDLRVELPEAQPGESTGELTRSATGEQTGELFGEPTGELIEELAGEPRSAPQHRRTAELNDV